MMTKAALIFLAFAAVFRVGVDATYPDPAETAAQSEP